MSSPVGPKKPVHYSPTARPGWRLPEPVPQIQPPGAAAKPLLGAAIAVQAAWVIALLAMALR